MPQSLIETNNRLKRAAASASVMLSGGLCLLKIFGAFYTGSLAILSSLIDSLADVFASSISFVAIRFSTRPASQEHRYGYGRAESISALVQSAFIAGSGLFVMYDGLVRLLDPKPLEKAELGIIIMAISLATTVALIVFQKDMGTGVYSDVGTRIDALISAELILTIFHPNTPLHDGAMVIENNKIHSAGVLLPLTEDPKLSWKYGTRHRAAIGMSEVSDAACLVVSEETGDVSVCLDGILKKYEDLMTLKSDLGKILGIKNENEQQEGLSFFNMIKKD